MTKLSLRIAICSLTAVIQAGTSSCSEETPQEPCPPVLFHAIWVSVQDAETMTRINTARGFVREGSYIDSLIIEGGVGFAAKERAGTYEVVVFKEGYMEWRQNNVVVTRDACNVQTVRFDIALEKQ
jgi:hypothetical protein